MARSAERDSSNPASAPTSDNFLIRKLLHFAPLSKKDRHVLDNLAANDEHFSANVDIVGEGDVPRSMFLLKEGMAIRYRTLPDGGRQIMTFLIPGDLCDMHVFLVKAMDHSIGTITSVEVAAISRESMMDLVANHPRRCRGSLVERVARGSDATGEDCLSWSPRRPRSRCIPVV